MSTVELSNYWDDFQSRVNHTIDSLKQGVLPKLERLTVHLTERCNLSCSYCNMRFSTKEMDFDLAQKIVDDYTHCGGNIIHFTGGEPTVVSYFEEICRYAKERGLQVSANTNALKRIEVKNIDKLKVSFDTADSTEFDRIVGVKGAFGSVSDNLQYYSSQMKEKMLSITAVLNRKTYKNMLELAEFVHKNFDVYNLYFSSYKGKNKELAFTQEDIEDMFKTSIPETKAFFERAGEEYSLRQLSLYKPSDFADSDCRFPENRSTPCYIQLSEMTIDVDGYCHNCSHLYRDGVKSPISLNINHDGLLMCFLKLKHSLCGDYCHLSDKCLSGCNTNLIGFNRAVQLGEYI